MVSKVANFAIDLPDANVAIQVSGTFGSRQEEAQRLGRLLRPKADGRPAHFYTIVTRDTRDQDFSANRQLFLTEQGYRYTIEDAEDTGMLDHTVKREIGGDRDQTSASSRAPPLISTASPAHRHHVQYAVAGSHSRR